MSLNRTWMSIVTMIFFVCSLAMPARVALASFEGNGAAPRMLTSAMKFIATEVFKLIKLSREENFPSGNYVGEAGYAPYHELEADVPVAVKAMVEQIHVGLLDGSIKTNISFASPSD
jgi:hypothetical protein